MDTIVDHIKAQLLKNPKDEIYIPIKTICKIPVIVIVCRNYSNTEYILKICAQRCENTYYCQPIQLEELKDTISSLQYHSASSTFRTTPTIDWSYLQCDNVEMDFTECCVCLLYTNAKTDCGHALCYSCFDQIKQVNDESPCPLCRDDVSYYDTFGDC